MKSNFIFCSIIIPFFLFSQSRDQIEVLNKIIEQNSSIGHYFINCKQLQTSFNSNSFIEVTGLEIPKNILEELSLASNESNELTWDENIISQLNSIYKLNSKCLAIGDIKDFFRESEEDKSIFTFSKPIFDKESRHCIITWTCYKSNGTSYGFSYFLVKIYNTWVIAAIYDGWIS